MVLIRDGSLDSPSKSIAPVNECEDDEGEDHGLYSDDRHPLGDRNGELDDPPGQGRRDVADHDDVREILDCERE